MFANEFTARAAQYKQELLKLKSFNEYHALWQKTSLPYSMRQSDPYSDAYNMEIQNIYSALTELDYGVDNEMTSTKIDEAGFKRGYPWITNRLDVIASEMIKVCQAMQALHKQSGEGPLEIVEFGCGWGNLALPLAKAGQKMTVVDIDNGFLERLSTIFAREEMPLATVQGDFTDAARRLPQRYDAAIFQASFHHCLAFQELLDIIERQVLKDNGQVYFFSEPVFPDYPFPWGLRYDGESLWAIMVNKWLELGFDQDFFAHLLLSKGFFLEKIPEIPGHLGPGWRGSRTKHEIDFNRWFLPSTFDKSFHQEHGHTGRFMKPTSLLPSITGTSRSTYHLRVRNYGTSPIEAWAEGEGKRASISVQPNEEMTWELTGLSGDITLKSTSFVPDQIYNSGDSRDVGLFIVSVRCS